jgi:hypothetical protein
VIYRIWLLITSCLQDSTYRAVRASRFANAKTSFPSRTDTGDHARQVRVYGQEGSVPTKSIKMRQVGGDPAQQRTRPKVRVWVQDRCIFSDPSPSAHKARSAQSPKVLLQGQDRCCFRGKTGESLGSRRVKNEPPCSPCD